MIIIINIVEEVSLIPEDPKSVRSRCPAIILAVRRIDRVSGRINSLIDSIITINGIRANGVPEGVRWVRRLFK